MKFNLFRNDKKTAKDELILFLIVVVCIGAGVAFAAKAPAFWIIDSVNMKVFGILWILVGVMLIPGLVYRLFTNDAKK